MPGVLGPEGLGRIRGDQGQVPAHFSLILASVNPPEAQREEAGYFTRGNLCGYFQSGQRVRLAAAAGEIRC